MLFLNQSGENQGKFSNQTLIQFAAAIGLDEKEFSVCLKSDKYRDEIIALRESAIKRGVQSTPTIFINGQKLVGASPFEEYKAVIESELDKIQNKQD